MSPHLGNPFFKYFFFLSYGRERYLYVILLLGAANYFIISIKKR